LVFDGQGTQKQRYLYGTVVDQVLAEESAVGVRWFLANEQGTIKDVVDNTGTVIDHITYDSFGRIVGQTSAVDLRFAYTGREWDGETGQYYYRARYYDPTVGRFINEDPLGFGAGDTNIYRYVGNSSTNAIDPSGLVSCDCSPKSEPSLLNRAFGVLKVVTGGIQVSGGVGLAAGGTAASGGFAAPVTVPVGVLIAARGADDVQSGLRQIYTGQQTETITHNVVANLTGNCTVAGVVDFGTGLVSAGGAIKGISALNKVRSAKAAPYRFRGDSRPPEEIFNTGLQPRGKNTDLYEYAASNTPSTYVGASKDFDVAVGFATNNGGRNGYVYTVKAPGGIDVNKALGSRTPYPLEQEVVFKGGINTNNIRGATPVNANGELGNFSILNPNFGR
jgi:RHS repeat-associated protein